VDLYRDGVRIQFLRALSFAILSLGCSPPSAAIRTEPRTQSDIMTSSDVAPAGTALYIVYFKKNSVPDVAAEAVALVRATGGTIRNIYKYVEGFSAYLTPEAAAKMAKFPNVFQVGKSGPVKIAGAAFPQMPDFM